MTNEIIVTWKGLVVATALFFGFVLSAAWVIKQMPDNKKTCSVYYSFSEQVTHASSWVISKDEECGEIEL